MNPMSPCFRMLYFRGGQSFTELTGMTNGRHRFAGVPFGVAPVGPGRFRRAEPAPPWTGEQPATAPGPSPMQSVGGPYSGLVPGMSATQVDEDCLTLNVWRPARPAGAPLPVMLSPPA